MGSVFGMRERTFEEALEQQRMQQGGAALLIQTSRKISKGAVNKNERKKREPKKKAQSKQQPPPPPKNVRLESNAAPIDEVIHVAQEAPVESALPPLAAEEVEELVSPVEEATTAASASKSA